MLLAQQALDDGPSSCSRASSLLRASHDPFDRSRCSGGVRASGRCSALIQWAILVDGGVTSAFPW